MSTDDGRRQGGRPPKWSKQRHSKPGQGGQWRRDRAPDRSPPPAEGDGDADGVVRLYGVHPVEAALANPARVIGKLFMTENAENRMRAALEKRGVTVERVSPRDLDRRLGSDTVHQGVLLETEPLEEQRMIDMAVGAAGRPLIVLDQVTDPHNVGAILRSCAVFGAAGVVMTKRHSPPLNGTLAKSASGALELVPVARVNNLARSLEELKEAGCTLIGLDGEGSETLDDTPWPAQPVFVLGAEGKGLRQLTRETCDCICRIATDSRLASLNVSNAAAVAMHLALMRRRKA